MIKAFFGHLCIILMVNIWQRMTQTLRISILLHSGLVTFRINFRRIRKPLMSMVFGLSGRDHDSQNQCYFIFGDTKILSNSKSKSQIVSKHIILRSVRMLEIDSFVIVGNGRGKSRISVLKCLANLGYGINIFQKA